VLFNWEKDKKITNIKHLQELAFSLHTNVEELWAEN